MKILNNKNSHRKTNTKPSLYDLTSIEKEDLHSRRDSFPFTSTTIRPKRQTCPNIILHHLSYRASPIIQNYSTVGRLSQEEMFDPKQAFANKMQAKILTLQELKGKKAEIVSQQIKEQKRSKSRKLFVSISKQNRGSVSKQKRVAAQPRLSEVGRQMGLLRNLSENRKILDMIQLQMEQSTRYNRFFCNL